MNANQKTRAQVQHAKHGDKSCPQMRSGHQQARDAWLQHALLCLVSISRHTSAGKLLHAARGCRNRPAKGVWVVTWKPRVLCPALPSQRRLSGEWRQHRVVNLVNRAIGEPQTQSAPPSRHASDADDNHAVRAVRFRRGHGHDRIGHTNALKCCSFWRRHVQSSTRHFWRDDKAGHGVKHWLADLGQCIVASPRSSRCQGEADRVRLGCACSEDTRRGHVPRSREPVLVGDGNRLVSVPRRPWRLVRLQETHGAEQACIEKGEVLSVTR